MISEKHRNVFIKASRCFFCATVTGGIGRFRRIECGKFVGFTPNSFRNQVLYVAQRGIGRTFSSIIHFSCCMANQENILSDYVESKLNNPNKVPAATRIYGIIPIFIENYDNRRFIFK